MYVRIFVYIYEQFFYIYQKTLKKPLKIWAVWRFCKTITLKILPLN